MLASLAHAHEHVFWTPLPRWYNCLEKNHFVVTGFFIFESETWEKHLHVIRNVFVSGKYYSQGISSKYLVAVMWDKFAHLISLLFLPYYRRLASSFQTPPHHSSKLPAILHWSLNLFKRALKSCIRQSLRRSENPYKHQRCRALLLESSLSYIYIYIYYIYIYIYMVIISSS